MMSNTTLSGGYRVNVEPTSQWDFMMAHAVTSVSRPKIYLQTRSLNGRPWCIQVVTTQNYQKHIGGTFIRVTTARMYVAIRDRNIIIAQTYPHTHTRSTSPPWQMWLTLGAYCTLYYAVYTRRERRGSL